ncbi:MAG: hypothetical protein A3K77_00500 [Euryarchaeota archaeon RBG_13_31_8]|nr:MAG: hypothetical protein A3K77_00500 [Euryarchaeota archaeon RBG_13_31_8]
MAEQVTAVSDIEGVGIAELIFNDYHLGATVGDTVVKIVETDYEDKIDKHAAPIAIYEIGTTIEVTAKLREETIAKLNRIMQSGTTDATKLTFGRQAGTAKTGYRLVVRPKDSNFHDVVVYKAVPRIDLSINYGNATSRIYEVRFTGLIDESRAENDKLFRFDESYSV